MQQTSEQDNMKKESIKTLGGNGMFKQMKKRVKNEKGLTLIELLAVIVILAIISAIAVPAIGGIIENSRAKALIADATNAMNAANLYFTDNPTDNDVTIAELVTEGFLETDGNLTAGTINRGTPNDLDGATGNIGATTFTFPNDVTLEDLAGASAKDGTIIGL